jgi:iron complex transport system substrate-binding protein
VSHDLATPLACVLALAGSALAGALAPEAAWAPRDVPTPARPARIVSLALPGDEITLALVAPSRVLALEEFVDDPRASNAVDLARAVRGRMRQPIVAETILAAEPDLVILPAWSDAQIGALLAYQGVATHRLGAASSLAEVREEIRALGAVLDERAGAEALVTAMDARLDAVRARGEARAERPTVLLAAWSGRTPARGTIFCEVVELAGARCAAAEAGLEGYAALPLEDLLALDPDVVVINRYRADASAREIVPELPLAQDPRYRTLRAVREHRVVDVPTEHLLATSHHVASLAEDLADALDASQLGSRP